MPMLLSLAAVAGHAQAPPAAHLRKRIASVVGDGPEATFGVAVRDPATPGTRLDLRAGRSFHAASMMKVPVLIALFRRAGRGDLALSDTITVENRFRSATDGSAYRVGDDTDDALYERQGEPVTIRNLARRMITRSSNLATNLLLEKVAPASVQQTAERLGAGSMNVRRGVEDLKAYREGLNNTATAGALAALLKALMQREAVSPEADRAMIDILLGQTYDTMIPAGLPDGAQAAHKTGWVTAIHHDAAIVYPETGAPYVLAIFTEGIADGTRSARLGAEITRAVHDHLRGSGRGVGKAKAVLR
jgi:beta-lactamase class A